MAQSTLNIRLYNIFRNDLHLQEDKAIELINAMEDIREDSIATKEFVREEIHKAELKLISWMAGLWVTQLTAVIVLFLTR